MTVLKAIVSVIEIHFFKVFPFSKQRQVSIDILDKIVAYFKGSKKTFFTVVLIKQKKNNFLTQTQE